MLKAAIILSTIDRYDLTVRCIGQALATTEYPFELLVCDNGSKDRRVIEYMASFDPVYHRLNEKNEGCAQMHNQMMLRTDADLFCLLDNDIEINRAGWLRQLVECYEAIPETGISGIHSIGLGHAPFPEKIINGKLVHPYVDTFGTRLFGRTVVDKIGYFNEDCFLYGLVDNLYNCRAHYAGFLNYYIGGPSGLHLGNDVGEASEYRRMKDEEMTKAFPNYAADMEKYAKGIDLYIPPPPLR